MKPASLAWGAACAGVAALGAAGHVAIAACHGEQSFDTALNLQFAFLALRGWDASGLLGITAFGDHFDPLFVLLAPLVAVWPQALALQLPKTLAYAAMLPGLGLLAREHLGARAAPWAAACVALSPMFWTPLFADYHTGTLAGALLPWLLLAYERERLGATLGLALAVALGKENLSLVVGGLGLLALFDRRGPRWWLSLGALGGVVFVVGAGLVMPACAPPGGHTALFGHLRSPAGWLAVVTRPSLYTWLGFLLLSGGALALRAPRALWPLVPLLLQHGLSARDTERMVEYHYLGPMLPLLAYAAIRGAARLRASSLARAWPALVGINLVLLLTLGPLPRLRALQPARGAARLAAAIPAGAPAWGSLSTVTRLAGRERLYFIEGLSSGRYPGRTWTFAPEFGPEGPPRHGLIDARDRDAGRLPPGLRAVDAVGDLLLLAAGGEASVLVHLPAPATPPPPLSPGEDGRYRVWLEAAPAGPLPRVLLRLQDARGRVVEERVHRLLFGLAHESGWWEARYRPPAFEGTLPPGRYELYARLPARAGWQLLSTYERTR